MKQLPERDREAIGGMLSDMAAAMDAANSLATGEASPDGHFEVGTRHLHLEIRRLLSRIADPLTGLGG